MTPTKERFVELGPKWNLVNNVEVEAFAAARGEMVWGLPVEEGRSLLARMDRIFDWFMISELERLNDDELHMDSDWLMGPAWMVYVRYWNELRALAEVERDVRPAVLRRVRRR